MLIMFQHFANLDEELMVFLTRAEVEGPLRHEKDIVSSAITCLNNKPPSPAIIITKPTL